MTRAERVTVLIVAALVAVFVVTLVTGVAAKLNGQGWFGGGANEIQLTSGIATFAAVAAGLLGYLNRTCAAKPFCLRFGEHPVDGTLRGVCTHHHTLEHHQAVYDRHGAAHAASERLDRGQSHRSERGVS